MNRTFFLSLFLAAVLLSSGMSPVVATKPQLLDETSNEVQISQTSGQVIGKPDISISTTANEFNPGSKAQFQLSLTNRGEITRAGPSQHEQQVTTARGATIQIKDGNTPFEIDAGTIAIGNIPTGTLQTRPISITVPDGVKPGTYKIPVQYEYVYTHIVSYSSSGTEYSDFTTKKTDTIKIHVENQAQFEIVEQNTTAQIGDTSDISITLKNTGTRIAKDASVSASSRSDELTFGTGSGSSTAYVGKSWHPNELRTINYSVALANDATQRSYTLDLNVDYTDKNGISQESQTLNSGVTTVQSQTFELREVNSSLRVGDEGQFEATIVNQGPQSIRSPVATLTSNNKNININNPEYALPYLTPGEQTSVNYSIDVSDAADASIQQFEIKLAYNNQNGERRTSDPLLANALIKQQQDQFIVEPINQTAVAGEKSTLKLRITNNGDRPIRNIEGKTFLDDPLSSSDDEIFIEQLKPGETTTVSIALNVGSSALVKTYPFSMDFQYETSDGDTKVSKTYNVPIQVERVQKKSGISLPLIGGIVVLILGIGGVWYTRRD